MTLPLISIVCTVRNRVETIRRCVESVLAQDYPNFELVVQDGASTDGTLDVLREYGDRIRLESRPDAGAGEGLFRSLNRCRGEIWGSCLSDEQLVPDALSWAQSVFAHEPDLGAIYGFVQNVDHSGRLLSYTDPGEFDLERLLSYDLIPPFPASFFRMDCFRQIGLREYTGAGEHDLWFRFAARFKIRYFPKLVAFYGQDPACLSSQPAMYQQERAARLQALHRLFHEDPAGMRLAHLEKKALAGYHVKYAILSIQGGCWDLARDHFDQAISADPSLKTAALCSAAWGPADAHDLIRAAIHRSEADLRLPPAASTVTPHRTVLEIMASRLVNHLMEPTADRCLACLPELDPSGVKHLVLAWTHHSIRRPFNIWRALLLFKARKVAIFGASGWGRSIAEDLVELGIEVSLFIENNSRFDFSMLGNIVHCTADEFSASSNVVDLVISSILGEHDAAIMRSLQQSRAEQATPVISWKTLAYLHLG